MTWLLWPWKNSSPAPTKQENGRTPKPFWTLQKREKSLPLAGIKPQFPGWLACRIGTILTELYQFMYLFCTVQKARVCCITNLHHTGLRSGTLLLATSREKYLTNNYSRVLQDAIWVSDLCDVTWDITTDDKGKCRMLIATLRYSLTICRGGLRILTQNMLG